MTEDPYYTDSIIRPDCRHYRLRNGHTIVGYLQINANGAEYYSKDNFWWRKSAIDHAEKDHSTEIFDINRQMIFEHDVIVIKKRSLDNYAKRGLIEYLINDKRFQINLLEEGVIKPFPTDQIQAPFRDDLRITGQLFP